MNLDDERLSLFCDMFGGNDFFEGYVRLHYMSVADIGGLSEDLSVIVIVNKTETAQVLVPCDANVKQEILLRVDPNVPLDTRRALRKRMPEVLGRMIGLDHRKDEYCIFFDWVVDGEYDVRIISKKASSIDEGYPIRASEGILLALVFGLEIRMNAKSYVYQSAAYEGATSQVPMPLNVMSDANLKAAMRKSVEVENYEVASAIRDELKRRHKDPQSSDQDPASSDLRPMSHD